MDISRFFKPESQAMRSARNALETIREKEAMIAKAGAKVVSDMEKFAEIREQYDRSNEMRKRKRQAGKNVVDH